MNNACPPSRAVRAFPREAHTVWPGNARSELIGTRLRVTEAEDRSPATSTFVQLIEPDTMDIIPTCEAIAFQADGDGRGPLGLGGGLVYSKKRNEIQIFRNDSWNKIISIKHNLTISYDLVGAVSRLCIEILVRSHEITRDHDIEFDDINEKNCSFRSPQSPGSLSEASAIENSELRRAPGCQPPCSLQAEYHRFRRPR